MLILAIETATRAGSLALLDGGECDARAGDPARTHGERLPLEAVSLLADHGRTLRDVDRFVVVAGPGSFTGLRVGMAAVQGLALVSGTPVAAVPTLDAMAELVLRRDAPGVGLAEASPSISAGSEAPAAREPVLLATILDGQRGDVFYAAWQAQPGMRIEDALGVVPPSVGTAVECARILAPFAPGGRAIVAGRDVAKHEAALSAIGVPVVAAPGILAEAAARIAERRADLAGPPHALQPIYIRRPDAVLAREARGA